MKSISLWQPWGSLWLSLIKLHETRHWHIKDQWKDWKTGDRIAVHAAKKFEKDHGSEFADILRRACGPTWYRDLPTGALIGTIAVTDCLPSDLIFGATKFNDMTPAQRDDFQCGDFTEGRYAWRGSDPVIFPQPIPWRGSQGIFNVPDDVIASAMAAP